MTSPSSLIRNILFNWSGMGVALLIGFIQAPIVVTGLGNTWYGVLVLVNQLTSYTWLFDVGIREAVVRYVSKHYARKEFNEINEIVRGAIIVYSAISIITMSVILVLILLLPTFFNIDKDNFETARIVLFIGGLGIAITWFFNTFIGILIGRQRFDIVQQIGMCMGLINFILVVASVKSGYGIISLFIINFATSMMSNALVYWKCKKLCPEIKIWPLKIRGQNFFNLINYGKFVFLNNMASKVVFGTDVLIIGIFLPVSAITFYSIPSMLVTYMRNLVSTATWVLNPFTSEMESKADPSTIVDLLERGTKFSYLVGLPICAVFLIMGKEFISLWVGTEYGERASSVLIILTIGCLSGLGHLAINAILYGLSRHHIIAYVRTLEAILNIVLTLVMVRIWDLVGVALGMAVSHLLLMGIVLPYLVCRTIDCSYKTYIMKSIFFPLIAVIPFALLCFAVNIKYPAKNLFMFFISVFSILPVYLASAWYISFSKEERKSYILFISKFMHGKKKS